MSKPRYEVFEGADGQHYWHLKAANGEILAQSEGYDSEGEAWDGVDAARKAAAETANTQPGELHLHDDWYVKRLDKEGTVQLRFGPYAVRLTPEEWASAVAHASAGGETEKQQRSALRLHSR